MDKQEIDEIAEKEPIEVLGLAINLTNNAHGLATEGNHGRTAS